MTDPLRVPVMDGEVVNNASPNVSVLANTIGYALAQRGVQFTADDAIAAAQRVVDQGLSVPGVRMSGDHCPECGRTYDGCTACDPPVYTTAVRPPETQEEILHNPERVKELADDWRYIQDLNRAFSERRAAADQPKDSA